MAGRADDLGLDALHLFDVVEVRVDGVERVLELPPCTGGPMAEIREAVLLRGFARPDLDALGLIAQELCDVRGGARIAERHHHVNVVCSWRAVVLHVMVVDDARIALRAEFALNARVEGIDVAEGHMRELLRVHEGAALWNWSTFRHCSGTPFIIEVFSGWFWHPLSGAVGHNKPGPRHK